MSERSLLAPLTDNPWCRDHCVRPCFHDWVKVDRETIIKSLAAMTGEPVDRFGHKARLISAVMWHGRRLGLTPGAPPTPGTQPTVSGRLTREQREEVTRLARQGYNHAAIAERFGIKPGYVSNLKHRKVHGV